MTTIVQAPLRRLLADETLAFLHSRYRRIHPDWSDRRVWSGIQAGLDLSKPANQTRLAAIGDYLHAAAEATA